MMNTARTMLTDAVQDRTKDILPGKAADPGMSGLHQKRLLSSPESLDVRLLIHRQRDSAVGRTDAKADGIADLDPEPQTS